MRKKCAEINFTSIAMFAFSGLRGSCNVCEHRTGSDVTCIAIQVGDSRPEHVVLAVAGPLAAQNPLQGPCRHSESYEKHARCQQLQWHPSGLLGSAGPAQRGWAAKIRT